MRKFFKNLKNNKKKKDSWKYTYTRESSYFSFNVYSNVELSEDELDIISNIISCSLEERNRIGYNVARGIVRNLNYKITSASANGSEHGRKWDIFL